jgi:hypothetical protein
MPAATTAACRRARGRHSARRTLSRNGMFGSMGPIERSVVSRLRFIACSPCSMPGTPRVAPASLRRSLCLPWMARRKRRSMRHCWRVCNAYVSMARMTPHGREPGRKKVESA